MLTLRKFKITNPYAGVDWDSWHHYKTNLHTHSTASDAQVDFSDMIKAYYDAGFDILAMTDHGVVNHGWNQKPRRIPVLSVSSIIKSRHGSATRNTARYSTAHTKTAGAA